MVGQNLKESAGRGLVIAAIVAIAGVLAAPAPPAHALKEGKQERQALKRCERAICEIILKRRKTADLLECNLEKTWQRRKIEKGASSKSIAWGFGDARCAANVKIDQAHLVNALTRKKYVAKLGKHPVNCEVERSNDVSPVKLTLNPKLKFKNGQLEDASLKIGDISGPGLIKGVIWTIAKLEKNFGMFQSDIVREVNKFINERCANKYPEMKP